MEFLLPPLINLIQNSAKVRKGLKISKRKILIFAYLAKINLIRLSGHGHQWPCLSPVYHTEHIQVRLIEIDFQINNTKFSFPQPVRASCRSSVNTCLASRKRFAGTLASSWTRCFSSVIISRDEKRNSCENKFNKLLFLLTSFSIPGLRTPLKSMWQFCKR